MESDLKIFRKGKNGDKTQRYCLDQKKSKRHNDNGRYLLKKKSFSWLITANSAMVEGPEKLKKFVNSNRSELRVNFKNTQKLNCLV